MSSGYQVVTVDAHGRHRWSAESLCDTLVQAKQRRAFFKASQPNCTYKIISLQELATMIQRRDPILNP